MRRPAPGGSLSVSVADSLTSEPLAGAVVELLGEDMERDTYATTGEDGIAVLHGVEDGKYFIRLSCSDMSPALTVWR